MAQQEHLITIIRPDSAQAGFTLQALTFRDAFEDQVGKLTMRVSKEHTILEDSRVSYFVDGSLKLLGQVDDIDTESELYDTVTITSHENLLNFRATQPYTYPDGTTLAEMLSDSPPASGKRVGLIYYMNSGLPPKWVLHSGRIYKQAGAGTNRLGSSCKLYENSAELTRVSSVASMTAGTFYQDANDLYVWTTSGVNPMYRLMTVPNWKDTRVRLGAIENGTSSWTVPFKISTDSGMDTIVGILWAKFQEVKWVPNVDGYVYLTSKATIGRGSEAEPVATFKYGEKGIQKIKTTVASGQTRINAVVTLGAGSGTSQLMSAAADMATTVSGQIWREDVFDSTSFYSFDMLTNLAEKLLADRRDNKIRVVKAKADWDLSSGDYIRLIPKDDMPTVKRIMAVTYNWPENTMEIEAGKRQVTFSDAFKKRLDMLRSLTSTAQSIATEWSESFRGNVDDANPLKTTFNLPSGKIDKTFPYKFTIRFTIEPYEVDTSSIETRAHNNGGVTGSHSGYGGTSTSSKTQDAHVVPQFTGPAGNPSTGIGTNVYTNGSGDHYHQFTFSYSGGAQVDLKSGSGISWGAGSGSTTSNGWHQHGIGYSGIAYVASSDHTHVVPQHSTNAAAAQSHETQHESSKIRQVFTEPQTPAEVVNFLKKLDTGNSLHYLDVDVKLNGTSIPGSPFLDLYIGDSPGDIDAGSLVIEGDNTIEFHIKDHNNPSQPVRCNISGSVAAEYYIDQYS